MAAMVSTAIAAPLSTYTNSTSFSIQTQEASGVAYDRDTNSFYVVGDEGFSVDRYSKTGGYLDQMLLDGSGPRDNWAIDDAEGVVYLGNGMIGISDERDNTFRVTSYEAGAKRTLAELTPTSHVFGPYAGNDGLEGTSSDPVTGTYWGVSGSKILALNPENGEVVEPVSSRNFTRLGINQMSDIYMLANSEFFSLDDPRRMNLLILSRNANEIFEITRAGILVDRLDLSFTGLTTIEGITMDDQGTLFLVAEGSLGTDPSHMIALTAVPEPSTYGMAIAAVLGGLAYIRSRKRRLAV